jgi:hypothetical protein
MKKQNILYGIALVAILSGCGINGESRNETGSQAQQTAEPTQYEVFKTVTGKSSLGEIKMEMATGYVSAEDTKFAYVGNLGYQVKETSINDSINGTMKINLIDSTPEYRVFLTTNSDDNSPVLVAIVNDDLKNKALQPILFSKDTFIPTDKITVCDTYAYMPEGGSYTDGTNIYGLRFNCNLETFKCKNIMTPQLELDIDNLLRQPTLYKCVSTPQDRYRSQKKLTESHILSNFTLVMDTNPRSLKVGKKEISIQDSAISFAP